MNWKQALAQIETHEFAAELNLASGTRGFFRAVARDPAVGVVREGMLRSGEACEEVLSRIYDLTKLDIDLRYENMNDVPLAVLLWLMYFASFNSGLAAYYVDHAPQCWYAKKLARRILVPPKSGTSETNASQGGQQPWYAINDSIDSMISVNPGNPWEASWGYTVSSRYGSSTGAVQIQVTL